MTTPVPSGMPAAPQPRKGLAARCVAFLGFGVLVLAVVLIVLGITRFDSGEFTDLVKDPASALQARVPSPGSTTLELSSGRYWVFAMGDRLDRSGTTAPGSDALGFTPPGLTVQGAGAPVAVNQPDSNVSVGGSSEDLVLIYEFRAPRDGRYTLTTEGGSARVTELGVGDTGELWESAKGILGPAALMITGGLLGLLGVVLWIVAAILWFVGRGRGEPETSHPPVDGAAPFG